MARVLVTGGTGVLGSQLVPRLIERGHTVRVLSRRAHPADAEGVTFVQGDVRTGTGLAEAVEGMDVVIAAATSPMRRPKATEVDGMRRTVAAAGAAHVIYVSIVGVDAIRYPYYGAKHAAEQIVAAEAPSWTIQRATQFHEGLDQFLGLGVWPSTPAMAFQPVSPGDVSDRLVDLVEAGPSGRVDDFGGPEILPIKEIVALRREVTGRRTRLVPVPRVGFFKGLHEGRHLTPEERVGTLTWDAWLRGTVAAPPASRG